MPRQKFEKQKSMKVSEHLLFRKFHAQIGGSDSTSKILTLTKTPTDDTVYDLFDAGKVIIEKSHGARFLRKISLI